MVGGGLAGGLDQLLIDGLTGQYRFGFGRSDGYRVDIGQSDPDVGAGVTAQGELGASCQPREAMVKRPVDS